MGSDIAAMSIFKDSLAEFKGHLLDHELAMLKADNAQIETVNQTIRSELASEDSYNSRWRSTFDYCVAPSWMINILVIPAILGLPVYRNPADL